MKHYDNDIFGAPSMKDIAKGARYTHRIDADTAKKLLVEER
ncbi:hypothetical protein [Peribacillus simplex]